MADLDLSKLSGLTVMPAESAEDALHRREEAQRDATHRRRKEWWTFVASLFVVTGVGVVGIYCTLWGSADQINYGRGILTTLLGAFGGYFAGKKTT